MYHEKEVCTNITYQGGSRQIRPERFWYRPEANSKAFLCRFGNIDEFTTVVPSCTVECGTWTEGCMSPSTSITILQKYKIS